MEQTLEQIAKRIIICSAKDIESWYDTGGVDTIFTVAATNDLRWQNFDFSQTHHATSNLHNLSSAYALSEEVYSQAIEKDLAVAEDFLKISHDRYVLFHCIAGIHRSPTFVFMLLCHLQGEQPDIDFSISLLHKIRPTSAPSMFIDAYKPYLGADFETYQKALEDYELARKLSHGPALIESGLSIKEIFTDGVIPPRKKLRALCGRFDMKFGF